jgi:hypothetical protein
MDYQFTNTQIALAVAALVLILAIVLAAYLQHRKTRTLALKNRFGSEYDRAVVTHGSPQKAEAKLADRETRVEALKIRDLAVAERERFIVQWEGVQARFVDHPKAAVTEADDLVNALLLARGYPQTTFEQRAADVSVTYPRVMENYRLANDVAARHGRLEATTEELRTAMIQYRAIFDELLQPQKPGAVLSAA